MQRSSFYDKSYSYYKKILSAFIIMALIMMTPEDGMQALETMEPLKVEVTGRDVKLDWSAMNDSGNYFLYYAMEDFKGEIDPATLGYIDMGTAKKLFIPGLPSGLILYAAVMGQDKTLSNIVKFMPFGGAVTYPETGDLLMQLDDLEGIGSISILGTRGSDNLADSISQIRGKSSHGDFTFKIADQRPASYEDDEVSIIFTYGSDDVIKYEIIPKRSENTIAEVKEKIPRNTSRAGINCDNFNNENEYLNSVKNIIINEADEELRYIEKYFGHPLRFLFTISALLHKKATSSDYYIRYMDANPQADSSVFLNTDPHFRKLQQVNAMARLIGLSMKTYDEVIEGITENYLDSYNMDCNTASTGSGCPLIYDKSLDVDGDNIYGGYMFGIFKCEYIIYDCEYDLEKYRDRPCKLYGEYPKPGGITHGPVKIFYYSGKPRYIIEYVDGLRNGRHETYNYDGDLVDCDMYKNGKKTGKCM